MSHFILLFCVLFGGFLAWAWWIKAHTGDDFDALRIIFDPVFQRESSAQMAETRRQAFQRFQMNNVAYGMNTQQQFIRPWERIYVDEIAAFTDKQYKYLSDKMKP